MIARVNVALAMLSLVGVTLTAPAIARAEAPAIEQSAWPAMKKRVKLANGITLAYVELGNPKGEPLLLLHGYTDSSRTWSLVAPYLGKYRLLMPDQRGHGASDSPDCCYSTAQYAFDAKLFLDRRASNAPTSSATRWARWSPSQWPPIFPNASARSA